MAKKRNFKNKANQKKNALSKSTPLKETINSEAIAAALSSINKPVLLKVCRLCESKDGPFLNIFDADRITAKKIEDVMPFGIAENDELPHKICFRCSAKLEELYEFIQKCVKTQLSLRKAAGKKGPVAMKVKTRTLWEEKLNQSNISNDDICDALIKKAMEGIKDIPLKLVQEEPAVVNKDIKNVPVSSKATIPKEDTNPNRDTVSKEDTALKRDNNFKEVRNVDDDKNEMPVKQIKKELDKKPSAFKSTRLSKAVINEDEKVEVIAETEIKNSKPKSKKVKDLKTDKRNTKDDIDDKTTVLSTSVTVEEKPTLDNKPPFNIMDHVSMIKVNGVGVLFQCKLCNRNFLKKEVVMSHACAKTGAIKTEPIKEISPPEPPKIPIVKYITTKPEADLKKPIVIDDSPISIDDDDDDDDDEDDKPLLSRRVKPKIGPASKIKKAQPALPPTISEPQPLPPQPIVTKPAATPSDCTSVQPPTVQFPTLPSLNSRYKLVPGPNNTFTLVEEQTNQIPVTSLEKPAIKPPDPPATTPPEPPKADTKISHKNKQGSKRGSSNNINVPEMSTTQPYPVGLFQTLAHNSNALNGPLASGPSSFPTPAMKKQSYTIVQTGNPSKLLISTKAQSPTEEVPKKRPRKTRHEEKIDDSQKQPFSVTLEDAAPPRDSGFFTFINVDPLLQPSYVLPTNNIIQESQITTSTNVVKQAEAKLDKDNKYTCNMCNEKFTREKKLLTHIQFHYKTMDEEDQLRSGGEAKKESTKRRGRPKRRADSVKTKSI